MSGTSLILAIIGHLVGDYLLQNDWMALHKKRLAYRCAIHCLIWTVCVCWFGRLGIFDSISWHYHRANAIGIFLMLFGTHFFQDYTNVISAWMDLIGQKQFRTGPCAPWSTIVVDNVWHILTIWVVWNLAV